MKFRVWLFFLVIFCLGLFEGACNKTETPKQSVKQSCDERPRTYQEDVKLIIDVNCVVCHQPGGSYQSLSLTSYSEVKRATDSGNLLKTIKHDIAVPAMPQGGQKLSETDISTIECWINKGYLK